MKKRAAFLDRDGVINIDHAYVHTIDKFDWIDGVLQAAATLYQDGWLLVIVTNQSGIGRGYYTEADFQTLNDWMSQQFAQHGAPLAGLYFCPHHPEKALPAYRENCDCRKPAPGMLLTAARELNLDLSASIIFGDKRSDMQAGLRAGCAERVLLGTDALVCPSPVEEATACFTGLAEAVCSSWYKKLLERL